MANNSNLNLRYNVGEGSQKVFIDGTSVDGTGGSDIELKYLLGVGYRDSGTEESKQQPEARLVCVGKPNIIPQISKCVITQDKIREGINVHVNQDDDGGITIDANVERFNVYTLNSNPQTTSTEPQDQPVTDASNTGYWNGSTYLKLFEIKEDEYQIPEDPSTDSTANLDPINSKTTPFWVRLPKIDNSQNTYSIGSSKNNQGESFITLTGYNSVSGDLTPTSVKIKPKDNDEIISIDTNAGSNTITVGHNKPSTISTRSITAGNDKYFTKIDLTIDDYGHVSGITSSNEGGITNAQKSGLCPQLPDDTTKYLRGDGTWEVPPGVTFSTTNSNSSYPIATTLTTSGNSGTIYTNGNSSLTYNPSTKSVNGANAYYADSDRSLKENITDLNTPENILDVPIVEFDWKDTKAHSVGVIAQDLEKVAPIAVSTSDSGLKSVNYTTFLLLRIAALEKELKEIKDKLK